MNNPPAELFALWMIYPPDTNDGQYAVEHDGKFEGFFDNEFKAWAFIKQEIVRRYDGH